MFAYTSYIRQFLPVVYIFVEQRNASAIRESLSGFLQRKFLHVADYRITPVGCQDEFLHNLWIFNDMNPSEPKRTHENQIQPNPTKRFRVSANVRRVSTKFPLSFRQCSLCFRQCSLISKTVIDPRARQGKIYFFNFNEYGHKVSDSHTQKSESKIFQRFSVGWQPELHLLRKRNRKCRFPTRTCFRMVAP